MKSFQIARGWWQTLFLTSLATLLRLPNLSTPHAVVFDETYYVKDGWSLWRAGYEMQAVPEADKKMLAGSTDILTDKASYVVHPPFGKWVIGLGEQIFGLNPFGWRFMVCMLGIAAVIILHRTARRLFKHELTAFLAALFMAVDGQAIVHSRTALLDQTLMFCTLAAFAAVVRDRDSVRAKLESGRQRLGFRPWLLVAAVLLALAIATKWSGLWFMVGCGLLVIFFTARTRTSLGRAKPWLRAIVYDTLPWVIPVMMVIVGVYLACWSGWLLHSGGWDRDWAELHPGEGILFLPEALRSLMHYHQTAWDFHVNLTSAHSYSANPWTWPLQMRPTSFFYEGYESGANFCRQGSCAAEVVALGNPLIWWAGSLAILHQVWRAVIARETRSMAIVLMFAVAWLPWMLYQQRTVFTFYSIVLLPYIALALAGSIGVFLGRADASGRSRGFRSLMAGLFLIAVIGLSYFYYPLWTGETISHAYWQAHMWFPSWI